MLSYSPSSDLLTSPSSYLHCILPASYLILPSPCLIGFLSHLHLILSSSYLAFILSCLHLIHSFILAISIAPLQVLYHSEALPTTARILYRSFTPKRTG